MARIITLTTDFGLGDHFAGVMKGVILGICPRARIVDLCHEVTPFEITEAAFVLAQSYRYFPAGTIHVAVVDPGVGTARRPILVQAAGQYFLGPDNGVFAMIYGAEKHKVRAITNAGYMLPAPGNTFHGRDVFAPAAAHLASGVTPARFGKIIEDYLKQDFYRPLRTGKRFWTGAVLKTDRFGNLITNYSIDEFQSVLTRPFEIAAGATRIRRLAATYAEMAPGEVFVIVGSSGYLELAANRSSAARILGLATGAPLELTIW